MAAAMVKSSESKHLLLLHLSDIHFREPRCLNLDTDQDHPVRKLLVNDIRAMVEKIGAVDAILVSGDIAFQGHPEEYEVAKEWFLEVASVACCPPSGVYVVPGNHDVDRSIAQERMVLSVRELVAKKGPGPEKDEELHKALEERESGNYFLKPIKHYNLFAAAYNCDVCPEAPFWTEILPISPGWQLKIHGLTTVLLSGPDDDNKGELYLGALQTVFPPEDGIIRLAIMHHPPEWLEDHDQVEDALWNNCSLHLIGHKHRERYFEGENGVRLTSGAVNPSREEHGWEPCYNFIKLAIEEEDSKNTLRVECHRRIWQADPQKFIARRTRDDNDVFVKTIRLHQPPQSFSKPLVEEGPEKMVEVGEQEFVENQGAGMVFSKRDLVYNFWKLSASQRRKIAQDLGLLERDDDKLPEQKRYRLAFERAHASHKIEELNEAVNKMLPT